jgi:multidrug efflux pump subunit AcrA (membrane-fusion protein)
MQVVVDNRSGALMPGAFANTRVELPQESQVLSIPAGALIFDQRGLLVATVDSANKVVLKPVTIARDLGQVIEISKGLERDDRVIESPPDGVSNGDPVRVVKGG